MKDAFFSKAAGLYSGCMYNQRNDGLVKKKTVEAAMLERLKEDTSKRKKKNRRKGKEDGPALGTYTRGTIPFSENYNRLAAKKRAHISVEEVIVHTKKKKHDGQTWVDSSDADLWARFIALRDEAIKNGLDVTDDEIWYSLVHDRNVKDRMSGVGDYERKMRKLKPSSTHRRSSSSAIKKSEIEILKEQNKRLQEQNNQVLVLQFPLCEGFYIPQQIKNIILKRTCPWSRCRLAVGPSLL
ncbi:hypothetical protein DM860_004030 [Cuscuta australis]|uniref:Uncharacterized protein n=1 Tax=Cuscuta australis TaxID=267555 RepID=A0A328CXH4_9ASTE|nr:hypothetical protein DM860_004030 [Cuscuta australis]